MLLIPREESTVIIISGSSAVTNLLWGTGGRRDEPQGSVQHRILQARRRCPPCVIPAKGSVGGFFYEQVVR